MRKRDFKAAMKENEKRQRDEGYRSSEGNLVRDLGEVKDTTSEVEPLIA